MPRLPRKRRGLQAAAPPPPTKKTRARPVSSMTQGYDFVRCILCGVMAHRDRFVTPKTGDVVGIDSGPYEPIARRQEFGGRRPREEGEAPRGAMSWSGISSADHETLVLLRERTQAALEMLNSMLGEEPKPKKRKPSK